MGVIKVNISKVYAKASDRHSTKTYRKNRVDKPNLQNHMDHYKSGNASLVNVSKNAISIYATLPVQVPQKTYNTVRLVALNTIPKTIKDISKEDFCIEFERRPFQLLKYHVIASGARADRISQGMSNAFGIPFMKAHKPKRTVRCYPFMTIYVSEKYQHQIHRLKKTLTKIKCKLPFTGYVKVHPNLNLVSIQKANQDHTSLKIVKKALKKQQIRELNGQMKRRVKLKTKRYTRTKVINGVRRYKY